MKKKRKSKNVVFLMVNFLLVIGVAMTPMPGSVGAQEQEGEYLLEDTIVTATKRDTKLMETPITVNAFTSERIDTQAIRSIDDIARLAPSIHFVRPETSRPMSSHIAIRGVWSTVSSSTTGIYLDDTPIQSRVLASGTYGFSTYPFVFDLERVEVLKGPQGTLFGSGSMGGTVRYITPKPDLTDYNVYARSEMGFIDNGGTTYEAGAAVGGPIIEDKLGFRLSAYYRQDGGYIDRVNTDPEPGEEPFAIMDNDPTTPPTVLPMRQKTKYVVEENANSTERQVLRGALLFAPTDDLEILASIYYQQLSYNDANEFWDHLSNPDEGLYQHGNPMRQNGKDRFLLPALTITWDAGPVRLFSSTSYYDRHDWAAEDLTVFEAGIWTGFWEFPVGMFAPSIVTDDYEGWTQEIRLESADPDSRLQWALGVFYQKNEQVNTHYVQNTFLPDMFGDVYGVPFELVFGQGLSDGLYTFAQNPLSSEDKQLAGFFHADFDLTEKLTVTAGLRVTEAEFSGRALYWGPVVGTDPVDDSASSEETPVTPRFGLSYQATETSLIYATAAKGFRLGGYNPQIGWYCTEELVSLGYKPTPDNPTGRPATYESDSLWSYELGTKNTLLGGRAQLNASVYYIDWEDIQQELWLDSCSFSVNFNGKTAEIKGFEVETTWLATDQLRLGMSFGYNDAKFKETVFGGPSGEGLSLVTAGDSIPVPPWGLNLSGQYDFLFLEREAFVRFDYEYHSEGPDDTPALNPANRSPVLPPPDPYTFVPLPSTQMLSLRAGTQIGNFSLSVFVKNLLNDNPNLGRDDKSFQPVPYGTDAHNYWGHTVTPRTIGATVIYRY